MLDLLDLKCNCCCIYTPVVIITKIVLWMSPQDFYRHIINTAFDIKAALRAMDAHSLETRLPLISHYYCGVLTFRAKNLLDLESILQDVLFDIVF